MSDIQIPSDQELNLRLLNLEVLNPAEAQLMAIEKTVEDIVLRGIEEDSVMKAIESAREILENAVTCKPKVRSCIVNKVLSLFSGYPELVKEASTWDLGVIVNMITRDEFTTEISGYNANTLEIIRQTIKNQLVSKEALKTDIEKHIENQSV